MHIIYRTNTYTTVTLKKMLSGLVETELTKPCSGYDLDKVTTAIRVDKVYPQILINFCFILLLLYLVPKLLVGGERKINILTHLQIKAGLLFLRPRRYYIQNKIILQQTKDKKLEHNIYALLSSPLPQVQSIIAQMLHQRALLATYNTLLKCTKSFKEYIFVL